MYVHACTHAHALITHIHILYTPYMHTHTHTVCTIRMHTCPCTCQPYIVCVYIHAHTYMQYIHDSYRPQSYLEPDQGGDDTERDGEEEVGLGDHSMT